MLLCTKSKSKRERKKPHGCMVCQEAIKIPPHGPSECHRVTVKYVLVSIAAGLESIGSLRFSRDLEVFMMVY